MGRGTRPLQAGGRLVLHIVPLASVMSRFGVRVQEAHSRSDLFRPISAHGYSPRFNFHGFINERGGELNHGYTQVYRDGKIEATKAGILRPWNEMVGLSGIAMERYIFEALALYMNGLRHLEVPPPFVVLITLDGVQGARYFVAEHAFLDDSTPFEESLLTLPECYIDDYGTEADYQRAIRPGLLPVQWTPT